MRAFRLTLSGVLVGAVCAVAVYGQEGVRQPASVQRTSFNEYKYNNYYEQETGTRATGGPSRGQDAAPAAGRPAAAAPAAPATPRSSCDSGGLCMRALLRRLFCPGPVDPRRSDLSRLQAGRSQAPVGSFPLPEAVHKVKMGGWLNQSYTWNPQHPSNGFNGPVTWTDRSNSYELNQLYYWIEARAITAAKAGRWGSRADFLFGTDYRFNTESNLETRYQFQGPKNFGNDRFYGLDYLQFFGEVAYNKSKFQASVTSSRRSVTK